MIGIPANLRASLASNSDAMECFLHLPEDIQSNVIIRANNVRKKHEMDNLISSLSCNNGNTRRK